MPSTHAPFVHVPLQHSAVVAQVCPPRAHAAHAPPLQRTPAQHAVDAVAAGAAELAAGHEAALRRATDLQDQVGAARSPRRCRSSSHRATSSPNQNQPPRDVQLFDPCWQRRPPMLRLTRSRGIEVDTLKEQDDVVPPRPRTMDWVTQLPPSTGLPVSTRTSDAPVSAGASPTGTRRAVGPPGRCAGRHRPGRRRRRPDRRVQARIARTIGGAVRAGRGAAATVKRPGQHAGEGKTGDRDAHPRLIVRPNG